ncbi:glycosyltransferase family 2 protein [Oleiharenicola lentus]|uniref:glycosyltransferase family 2 protein n=1 Tax=Oleiharenicola lentus TaxID=2508720 RepID=UPI003F66A0A1
MKSPVIYIFFNRPEVTQRTFRALRRQRPARLHLIADGPRAAKPDDIALCQETRWLVENMIDWPCEVTRDYADINLGCGRRISTGLTTAFAMLGEAIVLEDDILPHPDFFPFCDAMLATYRHDPDVHAISGFQPLGRYAPSRGPVVPSTFNWIWGWASWQRAWKDYRFDFKKAWESPIVRDGVRDYVNDALNFQWHRANFDQHVRGSVDTWDFQWSFALFSQRRVTLVSSVNLIQNLGFDSAATHTTAPEPYLQTLQVYPLVPAGRRRSTAKPDRLHDKLFGKIIHSHSPRRISLLRAFANTFGFFRPFFKS